MVAADIQKRAAADRVWEVDFLRGLSVILMVFYHLLYDLQVLCGVDDVFGLGVNVAGPFFLAAQSFFAGIFILLCGISSTLTRSNRRRALRLIGIAALITAATYVFDASQAIHFGILHCLGFSILTYGLLFERSGPRSLVAAGFLVIVLDVALSLALRNVPIRFDWLLPLGITSPSYSSMDFFPLLPWFGVYLFGTALGKTVYLPKRSLMSRQLPVSFINIAGRHSLLIYVVHQPLLLAVLYAAGLWRP